MMRLPLRLVWANIKAHPLRNLLTAGSVLLAVFLLCVLTATTKALTETVEAAKLVVGIESTIVDRFDTRAGRRAVVDCRVTDEDGRVLCVIEHEALIELF